MRERAERYVEAIVHLQELSGPSVLIVHGESVRLLQQSYQDSDKSLDLPPLTEQMRLKLDELVARHNVLVSMYPTLAEIDSHVAGNANEELVNRGDLRSMVDTARAAKILTADADQALTAVVNEIGGGLDEGVHVQRASESGKNLIRVVFRELWNYKKAIGVAAVGIPPALYAIGKWALANESILLKYFLNRPGMHDALMSVFHWLHSLPLL